MITPKSVDIFKGTRIISKEVDNSTFEDDIKPIFKIRASKKNSKISSNSCERFNSKQTR